MQATTPTMADLYAIASEEDDEPLAGQDHELTMDLLFLPLYTRLRGPRCFVARELRVYRNPENLRDYREPDVLVALDVPDQIRPGYALWLEGKAPDLVIEVLSPDSYENRDLTTKRAWYQQEGVREYVVVDPTGQFAPEPRLQAWRFGDLAAPGSGGESYVLADADGVLRSRVIAMGWVPRGEWVRLLDLTTDELLPLPWELEPRLREEIAARQEAQEQARQAAEQARHAAERAATEATARQQAEAQVHALEAELDRLRRLLEGRG